MNDEMRNPLSEAREDAEIASNLALKNENNSLPVAIMKLQGDIREGKNVFFTTLPTQTRNDKLAVLRINQRKTNDIESLVDGEPIEVTDFILSTATFVNKDNEVIVSPKLCLVDRAGNCKSVLAGVFIDEFLDLVKIMGCPSPDESFVISAKLNKGNGANRYYSMVLR